MRLENLPYRSLLYAALIALVTALFIAIGALYAIRTPPWQAPDEPAHYNYVAQVAGQGCCPVIAPGDWDAAELEALKAAQFPENADLSGIEYEDHQPPLYYLIASVVFDLTGGDLIALRLLSVTCGAGIVLAAFYTAARLFPRWPTLALAAAIFAGFVPQHVAILASVNNDSLAGLLLGVLTVVAVGYLGNPVTPGYDGKPQPWDESHRPHAAALGGFLGLIFLTKLTIYLPGVVIALLAVAWRWRLEGRPARWLASQLAWIGALALPLGALWWVRNALVYGFPDLLGQSAHQAVVVGQLHTGEFIAANGFGEYLRQFARVTYQSFWGQFGWMGVPMPARDYLLLGLFSLWALAGAVLLARGRGVLSMVGQQRGAVWILAWASLATLLEYGYYNLTFVQFQGRYLFPAMISIALVVGIGGWGWSATLRRWLGGEVWERRLAWLPVAAVAWMPPYAVWALLRYVIPNLG